MKKISFVLALCLLLSFGMNVVASAEEYAVTPRYNNVSRVDCFFTIQNNTATISIYVLGYDSVTSRISVKATLEKKAFLGLWWSDVDEWTASSTNATETFEFTKDVGSGTYRCTFEITVEGSGGSADVYTDEKTVKN